MSAIVIVMQEKIVCVAASGSPPRFEPGAIADDD